MMRLVLFLFVATYSDPASSKVVELTDEDFKSTLREIDAALVMFYAPWCGHCKQLKPEFKKAAEKLEAHDPPVQLLKIDCTEAGKKTCKKFGVTGYPTVKIFLKGVFLKEYDGPRDQAGIVKYMERQVSPSAKEITSKEAFEKFVSQENSVVVGFFKEPSTLKDVYLLVADSLREKFTFGITKVSGLADNDGVILFRPKQFVNVFEPSQIVYTGLESSYDLEAWLSKNMHGLVDHRTPQNKGEFKNPLVVAYYNVDFVKNAESTNYWRNMILKVAKDFANDFNFAVSAAEDFREELFDEFYMESLPSEKPVIFAKSKDKKKFGMDEGFSVENFTIFLTKLKAKELKPVLKSEPIPKHDSGPVRVAVGKNFNDVVLNNGQDTIIEFYSPRCDHCWLPVWTRLGAKMADEDVAVVKMDVASNDFPPTFTVEDYPTVYWLPKGDKENPVPYKGGKGLDEFIKHIAKHATKELKNYDRKGNPKKKEEL